ncbi:MAG: hydrogenase maturation protease [Bryobacterales bacterium]|nr:hydrogenase maturation protease [Bryobacterales bacterium]
MRVVVIGYGNPYRGDDAAGLIAAGILRRCLPPFADVRSITSDGTALLDAWRNADAAILVDAVVSGSEPGTVHRLTALPEIAPEMRFASSHSFGLADAVGLARTLDLLPQRMVIYGIEAAQFEEGAGLSEAVEAAVLKVSTGIAVDFHALTKGALRDTSDG